MPDDKLSLAIGKNAGYIHMLETNRNFAPTFETLAAILEVCGVEWDAFFYYSIPAYQQDKELIEKLKKLSPEKKEAILKLI